MPVPDYQSLMLPTLKALSDGVETSISELRARIAIAEGLTQEDVSEKLPSGRQTVFANRVGWALLGLDRAGLVQRVRRAVYRLTADGERLPAREPSRVEAVMQVIRGNENTCIQKVGHQYPTPRLRPSSLNVAIFLRPSIRNASVNAVRPSRVLTTIARAKRLLTRAPRVR